MSKEYYYMFSQGSYSDYCVGGLYKSKQEFSDSDFAVYAKEYLLEQVREKLIDYPDAITFVENLPTTSVDSVLYENFQILVEMTEQKSGWQIKNLPEEARILVYSIKKDFANYMETLGLLEEVAYEEVHCGG